MNQNILHTPEGVRDIYGREMARKLKCEELVRGKLRSFGYQDIQTPSFEYFDVFSNEVGTTPSKELYKFFDKEGNTLVLRPDFTPSMARCASTYFAESQVPVRFCYSGNTFTNAHALQGKLNEVTQMGAELIGDGSVQADAEMIALVVEALLSTGLEQFQVSIGEVEFFKGLCAAAGIDDATAADLRENISGKNIFGVEDTVKVLALPEKYAKAFTSLTELFGGVDILAKAKALVDNERSKGAVERLEALYDLLVKYGVEKYVSFDFGMLSKFRYYTGVIFKAFTYGVGDAIVTGGRYDNLLSTFGKDSPAIGFVCVVDDLMEALGYQHIQISIAEDNALIVYDTVTFEKALQKAIDLRKEGKFVELVPREGKDSDVFMEYGRTNRYGLIYFETEDGE